MDLKHVKVNLQSAKAEIEARLERTHKHIFQREEPVSAHLEEQVKQTENDDLVRALEQEGKEELRQINNALQRIESGAYRTCASCGRDIDQRRLQAIPYTDQCIACASRGETAS